MENVLKVESVHSDAIMDYHGTFGRIYNIKDGSGKTIGTIIEKFSGRGDRTTALVWEDGYSKRGLKKVYRENKAAMKAGMGFFATDRKC